MTDAIILAAGNSKRFGKDNKLFTDFNSTLLITHVVSEICKSKPVSYTHLPLQTTPYV